MKKLSYNYEKSNYRFKAGVKRVNVHKIELNLKTKKNKTISLTVYHLDQLNKI